MCELKKKVSFAAKPQIFYGKRKHFNEKVSISADDEESDDVDLDESLTKKLKIDSPLKQSTPIRECEDIVLFTDCNLLPPRFQFIADRLTAQQEDDCHFRDYGIDVDANNGQIQETEPKKVVPKYQNEKYEQLPKLTNNIPTNKILHEKVTNWLQNGLEKLHINDENKPMGNEKHILCHRDNRVNADLIDCIDEQDEDCEEIEVDENVEPNIALSSKSVKVIVTGKLRMSIYLNSGMITVHIIQAKALMSRWSEMYQVYVKITLLPDSCKRARCQTDVVEGTRNPVFDQKFSFDIGKEEKTKRLLVSVWNRNVKNGIKNSENDEILGCMSFGINHLQASKKKSAHGWYFLLTEELGRKKHLQANSTANKPELKIRAPKAIPKLNSDLLWMDKLVFSVPRSRGGYGFTVIGACPVKVGRVEEDSPAASVGLHQGDCITTINGQNVSRSTAESIVRIVRHSQKQVYIEVQRPRLVEKLESSPRKLHSQRKMQKLLTADEQCKENGVDVGFHGRLTRGVTTIKPTLGMTFQELSPEEQKRQNVIEKLFTCERMFIHSMQYGLGRYSRPLRHRIISIQQYTTLFQNVEKLVTIAEYYSQQLQDHRVSYTNEERQHQGFVDDIGSIYLTQINNLCEAYESYCSGLRQADRLLADLKYLPEFNKFLQEPPIEESQPDISGFLHYPPEHLRQLLLLLQNIFAATPGQHRDRTKLRKVIDVLRKCCNKVYSKAPSQPQARNNMDQKVDQANVDIAHQYKNTQHTTRSQPDGAVIQETNTPNNHTSSVPHKQRDHSASPSKTNEPHYVDMNAPEKQIAQKKHSVEKSPRKFRLAGSNSASSPHMGSAANNEHTYENMPMDGITATPSSDVFDKSSAYSDPTSTQLRSPYKMTGEKTRGISRSKSDRRPKSLYDSSQQNTQQPASNGSCKTKTHTEKARDRLSMSGITDSPIDAEMFGIQNKLTFSKNIPSFQLYKAGRHLIYQGDLLKVEGKKWIKLHAMLFSDLFLMTVLEDNNFLTVIEEPIYLQDVVVYSFACSHPSEFHLQARDRVTGFSRDKLILRVPTADQKFTWKSLLHQRINAIRTLKGVYVDELKSPSILKQTTESIPDLEKYFPETSPITCEYSTMKDNFPSKVTSKTIRTPEKLKIKKSLTAELNESTEMLPSQRKSEFEDSNATDYEKLESVRIKKRSYSDEYLPSVGVPSPPPGSLASDSEMEKARIMTSNENIIGASPKKDKRGKIMSILRPIRRSHSAGCAKDVPLFLEKRDKLLREGRQGIDESEDINDKEDYRKDPPENINAQKGEKHHKYSKRISNLAHDMKMKLGFIRRTKTDMVLSKEASGPSTERSSHPSPGQAIKWSQNFDNLLSNKYGLALFRAFLRTEFSEENIEFWIACEDYKQMRVTAKLQQKAQQIYNDFIIVQGPKEVNLDSKTRTITAASIERPNRSTFELAQKRIQALMEKDSYPRFLRSDLYQELIKSRK